MASLPPDPSQAQQPLPAPSSFPAAGGAVLPENDYELLGMFADQGLDVLQFLSGEPADDRKGAQDVRKGASLPGEGPQEIRLKDDELTNLAGELCDLLDEYDGVMETRNDIEGEILDNYALRPDPSRGDTQPGSARMVSELTMTTIDQVAARLSSNMLEVEPLASIQPVTKAEADEDEGTIQMAQSAENFLDSYLKRQCEADRFLPLAIFGTVAVGTSVLYPEWRIESRKRYGYGTDGKSTKNRERRGGVYVNIIPNRHVKVWPPTVRNWQEAELLGHESWLSISQWRERAAQWMKTKERPWGLTAEEIATIEAHAETATGDERGEKRQAAQGIETSQAQTLGKRVPLMQLYCRRQLGDDPEIGSYLVYLCRPARKILFLSENPFHCQRMPYFPLRYKLIGESAWGMGAGQEILYHQAADTTLWDVELDNIMAGAYSVILRNASSMRETLSDRPFPGMVIPVEDPNNDFIPRALGSEVPQLQAAKDDNRFRAQSATGQTPVSSGMGDPVQKSGASSGATVALIEQSGKKTGAIDRTIRTDFGDFLSFVLELVAQYAPNGVFYRFAAADDAETLKLLQFVPPRDAIDEIFHIKVQAPSAGTSREARRSGYLMAWQFLMQHMQMWLPQAMQYLQQSNPAEIPALQAKVLSFARFVAGKVLQDYDLPGVTDQIPDIPQPVPQDQVINSLQQQLQQLQAQLQQYQQPPLAPPQQALGAGQGQGQPGGAQGAPGAPQVAPAAVPPYEGQPPQPQAPPPGIFG